MKASVLRLAVITAALLAVLGTPGATPAAAATHRVMLVGDSITHGSSGDYTWRYRLAKSLQATRGGDAIDLVGGRTGLFDHIAGVANENAQYADASFDRHHHALWGRQLEQEKETIAAAAASARPSAIVVHLGTNDQLIASPAEAAQDLRTLIARARAASPGVDIVLARLYPRWNPFDKTYAGGPWVENFNARLGNIAKSLNTPAERVVVAGNAGFDAQRMTWDGTHPDPNGEIKIATGVANALQKVGVGGGWRGPASAGWPVRGPKPRLAGAGNGQLRLTWKTNAVGATGYLVEQRNVTLKEGWKRLPIPLQRASGGWTAGALVPGHVYAYRLVPAKGLLTGRPGPGTRRKVPGTKPARGHGLKVTGKTLDTVDLKWKASRGATAYYIEQRPKGGKKQRLAYPVAALKFSPGLLSPGRTYDFRIVPINGAIEGKPSKWLRVTTWAIAKSYSAAWASGTRYAAGRTHTSLRGPVLADQRHRGIVQLRFFIPYKSTGPFKGDGRDFVRASSVRSGSSSAITAKRRVTVTWDTTNGNVVADASKTCLTGKAAGAALAATLGMSPAAFFALLVSQDNCLDALPFEQPAFSQTLDGADGEPTTNRVAGAAAGNGLQLAMNAGNSFARIANQVHVNTPTIDLVMRVAVVGGRFRVPEFTGNDYPAMEAVFYPQSTQFKPYLIATRSISDGGLLGVTHGTRATTPRGLWNDLAWVRCTQGSKVAMRCRDAR